MPHPPEQFVRCPACEGLGVEVNPRLRKQDGVCQLCFGAKLISPEPCRCGRPRRFDEWGWVEEQEVFCCGRKECREEFEKRVPKRGEKVYVYMGQQNYSGFSVKDFRRNQHNGYEGGWVDGWMGGGE